MQIQVHTDNHIEGREGLSAHVQTVVEKRLKRVGSRVTRVEVHISDQSGTRSGPEDVRCKMEARVERVQPTTVTHDAPNVNLAIEGAAEKLERALEHLVGRMRDNR